MMDTPGARLKAARERMGYRTAKDAALAIGVPVATYAEHENAPRFLPARRAQLYAGVYHTTPEWLLYGRDTCETPTVPLLAAFGGDTHRAVTVATVVSTATRALAISSEDAFNQSLLGWLALFEDSRLDITPDLHGELCVVAFRQYPDDLLVLRVRCLEPASAPGFYHLTANPLPTLFDVLVVWARRVTAMIPS